MKAAVCHEFGKPLVIEDVELNDPEFGEVHIFYYQGFTKRSR